MPLDDNRLGTSAGDGSRLDTNCYHHKHLTLTLTLNLTLTLKRKRKQQQQQQKRKKQRKKRKKKCDPSGLEPRNSIIRLSLVRQTNQLR